MTVRDNVASNDWYVQSPFKGKARQGKFGLVTLLLLVAAVGHASITFEIPPNGGSLPAKFSGTNCIAYGRAIKTGSGYLTQVRLFLKNSAGVTTEVSVWAAPPDPEPPEQPIRHHSIGRKVRFASTHFEHGTNLKIYMKAKDDSGTEYTSAEYSVPIFNKGLIYEHGQFSGLGWMSGGLSAEMAFEATNHTPMIQERNNTWTKALFLADFGKCVCRAHRFTWHRRWDI